MEMPVQQVRNARRQTLGDVLRRSALRYPERVAVRFGSQVWTYAEFDALCDRLAAGLQKRGIQQGERVAILARNSNAFVALRFATARIGAIFVPINFMLKADDVAFILQNAGAKMLCFDTTCQEVALAANKGLSLATAWFPNAELNPSERAPFGVTTFDDLRAATQPLIDNDLSDDAPLQIIYTSGTESRPKGAVLTHAAVISEYVSCLVDTDIRSGDHILHALPLFHCAQLDAFFGPAIYVGAVNVITSKPTPDVIMELIEAHGINSFFAPPTVWISILRSPLFKSEKFAGVQKGYYGASIMPVEVLKQMQREMPSLRLWNLYGQTEIAPVATVLQPEDQLRKLGSAGRATLNVQTRLVDDDMNEVPVGAVGEIVHRSPHLMSSYYNDPAKTRAAFDGGWFHSGDLGYRDDEGYIYVVDRKKDMIKSGGENVASREVEEFLYTIDGVSEVAVVGVPHPDWIEAVVAIIVRKPDSTLTEQDVLAACKRGLANFKVPKQVHFQDSLPKNPSGKLLKRELRRQLMESQ